MPPPTTAATLTTTEACVVLGVNRHTLRTYEARGYIKRVGTLATLGARAVLYDAAEVTAARDRIKSEAEAKAKAKAEAEAEARAARAARASPPPFVPPPGTVTAVEAARMLGITTDHLGRWNASGRLRPVAYVPWHNKTAWRVYALDEIEALVQAGRQVAPQHRVAAVADAVRSGLRLADALDAASVPATTWSVWARTRGDAAEVATLAAQAPPVKRRPVPGTAHAGKIGRVYFISGRGRADAVKIGWTQGDVQARLETLQSGSPVLLVVLVDVRAFYAFERWCHRQLHEDRVHGEWFRRSPRLARFIDWLVDVGDVTDRTPAEMLGIMAPPPLHLFATGGHDGSAP